MNILPPYFFQEVRIGKFVRRLNRFVIELTLDGKKTFAHLPNPGRLWELLVPNATVFVTPAKKAEGKYTYSCVAVKKEGKVVLLHTQQINVIARMLIEDNLIPSLKDAVVEKTEVKWGKHRFDLLLRQGSKRIIMEVKCCTLFGKAVAMFPDAVTVRGREHIQSLARLNDKDIRTGVLFIVATNHVSLFSPDYHTDFAFARTLLENRENLLVKAVGLSWNEELSPVGPVRNIPIPWSIIAEEANDRGAYLLLLEVRQPAQVAIGSLGVLSIPSGFYIYVGSARKMLSKRLQRHVRIHKKPFWHIDYLRPHASLVIPIAIRTSQNLEHELAQELHLITPASIPRFGASDCDCVSHLFYFEEHPLRNPSFLKLLEKYRIDYLSTLINRELP